METIPQMPQGAKEAPEGVTKVKTSEAAAVDAATASNPQNQEDETNVGQEKEFPVPQEEVNKEPHVSMAPADDEQIVAVHSDTPGSPPQSHEDATSVSTETEWKINNPRTLLTKGALPVPGTHEVDPEKVAKSATKVEKTLKKERQVALKKLTGEEAAKLEKLVAMVRPGLDSMGITERVLREIRDSQLWRGTHHDFNSWCKDQLEISQQRVSQLLSFAEEIVFLEDQKVDEALIPKTERAMRELRRASSENKVKVLQLAAELSKDGSLTAVLIAEARNMIEGSEEEKKDDKVIKVEAALKAAKLVDAFLKTCNRKDLRIGDVDAFKVVVQNITQEAKNLEPQNA